MYSLRRFASYGKGVEINQWLGKSYTKIHKHQNLDVFKETFHKFFGRDWVDPEKHANPDWDSRRVFAFICWECEIQPIYKNQLNFIVTEGGTTYERLKSYDGDEKDDETPEDQKELKQGPEVEATAKGL